MLSPFRFTGREWDQQVNLYYYRARYYDPTVGRFISEDPIGFGGGGNFYRYALDNPLRYIDPLGLSQQDVQKIIDTSQRVTDQMTADGQRLNNGSLNNIVTTGELVGRKKNRHLGCGEQADRVASELQNQKYDDHWRFVDQNEGQSWPLPPYPLPHQWKLAISDNPSDPMIVIDPFKNKFYPIGPNQSSSGTGGGNTF